MKPIFACKYVSYCAALFCVPLVAHAQKPISKSTKTVAKIQKISVAGVDVTRLDKTQMTRRLKRELAPKLKRRVVFTAGTRKAVRARRDMGIELDVGRMVARAQSKRRFTPLMLRVNSKTARVALKRLSPTFAVSPRDARIINKRRGMQIVDEIVGQKLNLGAALPRLVRAIESDAGAPFVDLPVRKQNPRRTRAAFKGITGRLATFSTDYNAGQIGRTFNMKLASRAIDGVLVRPGSTFSLNNTVGERTKARGYREAIIFEDGKKKPGLGGGVSQITGTLFNGALEAGLPIVTYQTHSRPVAYLPIGRDATVSWGNFDMKWKNNTGAPIYITYVMQNGTATATLFGKRTTGQDVRLNVSRRTLGARRIDAKLFRTILRNGKVVSKQQIGSSNYNWKSDNED